MIKRGVIMAVALLLVFGGVIGFKLFKQAAIRDYLETMGTPAVHLNAVVARKETWDQRLAAIGTLRARRGIDIRSEVSGVIRAVHMNSGDNVDAGDLLVELDDTVDQATLKSARVRLDKARRDFERDRKLFERQLISEDEFENSRSEYESAQAKVEETQGIIDKKTIRAPFAGTVGIHSLAEGHYLGAGDEVVTLQALDALYLDMQVPENELENLRSGQQVVFTVPTYGEREFTGTVSSIDARVRASTRNILVRAEVANPERELLPGMFADARIILDEALDVVSVPRQAVAFSLYGETVYLLQRRADAPQDEPGWQVKRLRVTSGETREGRVAVEGLEAGQLIALDTQHRLLDGTPVVIENRDEVDLGSATPEPR